MPFSDHGLIDRQMPDASHIAILLKSLKGGHAYKLIAHIRLVTRRFATVCYVA